MDGDANSMKYINTDNLINLYIKNKAFSRVVIHTLRE